MYWFQKFKFLYLILLAVLVYGFFPINAEAQEYKIWVSRQYYNWSNHYIVWTWSNIYEKEYFTGVAFCSWYFYLNHWTDTTQDIGLARQVLWYDNINTNLFYDYLNLIPGYGWEDKWEAWLEFWNSRYLIKFPIHLEWSNSQFIPKTFTVGRVLVLNTWSTDTVTISGHYIYDNPTDQKSTFLVHAWNNQFRDLADSWYSVSIVYYAQPCVPDAYIATNDVTPINGWSTNPANGALARVPAFHGKSAQNNAGRPVTTASETLVGRSNISNFLPWERNTSSFQNHITLDNGIFIAGIKEPDISSYPNMSFAQRYWYDGWTAMLSGFTTLDSSFVYSSDNSLSNQRWINPDTIRVTVSFTGVDKTNFGDAGLYCTVVVTWSNLGLVGLGQLSWNRNQLWYSVNITSGTIRTLAKQQCWFWSVSEWDIDLKRETVASVSWDAYDYSNSMIISQESNVESYRGPNRITGTTWYSFNSFSDNPLLFMSTDSANLINSNTVYNIPVNNSQLRFTGTDTYAGINSGTFLIIVTWQESSLMKSNSWQAWTIRSYVYSWNDISKFWYAGPIDRENYTWFVDFMSKLTPTTGMHFTVRFEATDFVGNKTIQNYIFRTPTWPNAPKPTWSLAKTAQTRSLIDQINIIDNIKNIDTVDGTDPWYNYWSYYPSHQALIADFAYISWSQNLTGNQSLVLTAENWNVWWATVVTMTWLTFVYDGSGSSITGTPYVSNGWSPMDDYLATNFTFSILATNIYGITGVITYTINVAPSCTESPGCTDPVYVFWGTSLTGAQAQRTAAMASGTDYLNSNHWYPHWFAQIKQTWPNFYFTGVAWEPNAVALYCASTGNQLLINYGGYSDPQSNILSVSSQTFTGSTLIVSGSVVNLFDNVSFPTELTANYETVPDNGNQKMTIYVNRLLTGRVFYSVCEFTGTTLNVFGCPVAWNYTGDVNWTRLTSSDQFVMTWRIEWWWFTGNRNGYVTGWSVNNWDQFDFWSTGVVSNGWWTRKYVRTITGDLDQEINTSWSVSFNITNRTWANLNVSHEVYWIDNIAPDLTGYISATAANQSATLTLSGYNTWVLATSFTNNLIWDDEYIVTKFSGDIEPSIFQNWYGSTVHTWQWYIDGSGSEYKMIHAITFAQDWEWQMCVEDRAGNESCIEVEVTGIGLHKDLVITVRPAFRPEPTESVTWYAILSWEFWFWVKSGTEWTQNYNSAKNPWINPKITTNKYGTGIVSIMTPASGAEYLVVFKWSGTLSAGFTGIWTDDITELNFFSGDYANTFNSDFVYKYNNAWTIEHYLKVWDISVNGTWDYDSIITADFALINDNLTIGAFNSPIRYDFDLNNVISSMEQSMILQAFLNRWFIWWLDSQYIIMMDQFIDL